MEGGRGDVGGPASSVVLVAGASSLGSKLLAHAKPYERWRGASAFAVAQSASFVRESRSMAGSFGRVSVAVAAAVSRVATALGIGTYLGDTVAQLAWLPTWLSAAASWLGSPPPAEMNCHGGRILCLT